MNNPGDTSENNSGDKGSRSTVSPKRGLLGWIHQQLKLLTHDCNLDDNVQLVRSQLGLGQQQVNASSSYSAPHITPTESYARVLIYAPDMDGQSEAGEIVWTPLDIYKNAPATPQPLLVIARQGHSLLTLYISSEPEHDGDPHWMPIGIGPWNSEGKPAWLRTDIVLEVSESDVQRRGAVLPPKRYERLATILRGEYGWS